MGYSLERELQPKLYFSSWERSNDRAEGTSLTALCVDLSITISIRTGPVDLKGVGPIEEVEDLEHAGDLGLIT